MCVCARGCGRPPPSLPLTPGGFTHTRTHAHPPPPPPAELPLDERLAFLRETRHAFGRTALVLSGGGSFGSFHMVRARACARERTSVCMCVHLGGLVGGWLGGWARAVQRRWCSGPPDTHHCPPAPPTSPPAPPTQGVVRALHEANLLPRVLSGSSAGAVGECACKRVCVWTGGWGGAWEAALGALRSLAPLPRPPPPPPRPCLTCPLSVPTTTPATPPNPPTSSTRSVRHHLHALRRRAGRALPLTARHGWHRLLLIQHSRPDHPPPAAQGVCVCVFGWLVG